MKTNPVCIARIYLTEGDHQLDSIMSYIYDCESPCGATVLRGIEGYGKSGKIHEASLIDLSFDLPIIIEFFDHPDSVLSTVQHLKEQFQISHAVSWLAESHH